MNEYECNNAFCDCFRTCIFGKEEFKKVDSSHTNLTENAKNKYTTTAGKSACKNCNPLLYITE